MISNLNNSGNIIDILTRSQNNVLRRTRRRLPIIEDGEYSTIIGIETQKQKPQEIRKKHPESALNEDQSLSIVDRKHSINSEERVTVQYLNNYTQLSNNHNCWSGLRNFYNNRNASKIIDTKDKDTEKEREQPENALKDHHIDTYDSNQTTILNPRLSFKQFHLIHSDNNKNENRGQSNNKNFLKRKIEAREEKVYMKADSGDGKTDLYSIQQERTEDEEYAFRCIESVHNYAKLSSFSKNQEEEAEVCPMANAKNFKDNNNNSHDNDNHCSKIDCINGGVGKRSDKKKDLVEVDNANQSNKRTKLDGSDMEYEHYFKKRFHYQQHRHQRNRDQRHGFLILNGCNNAIPDDSQQTSEIQLKNNDCKSIPQHHNHARRPMNAFLIFCKRHRAIVKERYKTLENRGITKILGEWWASLNTGDKECFVKLAKQNKDVFFSANPNFKWYKLPTTQIRNDSEPNSMNQHSEDDITGERTSFKLDLAAERGIPNGFECKTKIKESLALHKVLGETKQFLTEQMPTITTEWTSMQLKTTKPHVKQLKKHKHDKNSLLSNSIRNQAPKNIYEDSLLESDTDTVPKKKYNRLCKGKIYQELINSGQLIGASAQATATATAAEVTASTTFGNSRRKNGNRIGIGLNERKDQEYVCVETLNSHNAGNQSYNSISTFTSPNSRMLPVGQIPAEEETFDLEKKIKELPALDLDYYLQSKRRNTKRKRKFSTLRANSTRNKKWKNGAGTKIGDFMDESKECPQQHHENEEFRRNVNDSAVEQENCRELQQHEQQQLQDTETREPQKRIEQQAGAVVGSQKRKARKESITRRDVSSIENEFLSINGCCYLETVNPNELLTMSTPKSITNETMIPLPTSDLLILAEVASNRSELKQ